MELKDLNSLNYWKKDSSNNISYSDGNVAIVKDVSISGTAIINNTTTIDNVFFVNNNDSENQWNSYGNELVEGQNESEFGNGCSINGRGNIVATGAYKYDNNFINRGLVRVFKYDGSSWNQYGQDIFGRDLSNAYFGYNVCLNNEGNILAVNSPASDAASSDRIMMVKVFKYDGSSWNQYGQDISGESTTDVYSYGNAIFLNNDGDKLVVGEPAFNSKKGRVRTYQYQDSTSKWVQFGQDLSGVVANEKLGSNVCFNSTGTIMTIGNNISHYNVALNKVYIYKYNETSNIWESYGNTISVPNQPPSVSLNDQGNILAIGNTEGIDINHIRRGAVNVFVFDDSINDWKQYGQQIVTPTTGGGFGFSVSLNSQGNILTASGPRDLYNRKGVVGFYKYNELSLTWESYGQELYANNATDLFGNSCSINDDGTIVSVGASGKGCLQIFQSSGSDYVGIGTLLPTSELDVTGTIQGRKFQGASNCEANGLGSVAFGTGTIIHSEGGLVAGTYNDNSGALFVVGNGTGSGARSDALTLDNGGNLDIKGDLTAFSTSDIRLKTNVTKIKDPLDKLGKINGYMYDWIENGDTPHKGRDVGVIAQEIEAILPELTITRDNGYKAVKYDKIVALLIECIKEQQTQIDALKQG